MAFPRKLLNDREELILDLRPHWIALAPPVLLLVVAVVVGLLVIFAWDPSGSLKTVVSVLAGVFVLGALAFFARRYSIWTTTNFVLTGDRIISRHGVVAKSGIEIPLDRVNTVFFHQSVFERLVGAGDLTIESAGERGSETFSDIRKPAQVQREIYVQMEGNTSRDYQRMGEAARAAAPAAAAPAAPTLSVPEQLEKLDELRRRGVLSEAEFQAQKTQLLGPSA